MSGLQLAELDYLYKKTAASTVKTDNATTKILATSETIFTSPIISSDNVWTESATLELGPSFSSSIVSLRTRVKMTSARGVGPNPDIVALTGVAWTSGITNWVDKKFHIGFAPTFEVASGDNPAPGDYKTIDNSSDYPMIFDYKSGVLTFLVTPYAANGVDLTAKTGTDTTWHVYITGYTYLGGTLENVISQQQFSDPIAIGTGAGDFLQGVVDTIDLPSLQARPDKDVTLDWRTVGSNNTFDVSAYMAANNVNYCRLEMTAVGGGGGTLVGTINNVLYYVGGGSGGILKDITIENVTGVITGNVGKGNDNTAPGDGFFNFNVRTAYVPPPLPPFYAGNGGDTIVSVNGKIYTATGGQEAALDSVFAGLNTVIWFPFGSRGGTPNGVAGTHGNNGNGGTLNSIAPDIYPFGSGGQRFVNQSRGTQGIIKIKLKFFINPSLLSTISGSIAIGVNAGAHIQQKNAIAIGRNAGQTGQGSNAIAIGYNAGQTGQYPGSIAIGQSASNLYPGYDGPGGIAIGRRARTAYTGVAIGENSTAATDGGGGSLALGVNAFALVPRSIVINGSGAGLTSTVSGLYVDPIRTSGARSGLLEYNPSTKEITHAQVYAYSYGKSTNDNGSTTYVRWDEVMTATTSDAMAAGLWTCPKTGYWKMDATILENGDNTKYFFRADKPIIGSVFLLNDNYDILQYRSMHLIALLYVGDKIGIGTWRGVNYARAGSSFTIYYIGSS
jgi:hypothetical protein